MKKLCVIGLALAVATVAGVAGRVLAAEGAAEAEAPAGVKVTITGTNYCPETTLGKAGKAPKLGLDACRHALKVSEAVGADGKAIDAMKGWTLHYLYSEASAPLSSDKAYFGKPVVVTGTAYKSERVIEVEKVELKKEDIAGLGGQEQDEFAAFDYSAGGGSASTQR
ncbi:MAG: hypothetical protein JXR94_24205 [Candidatus Hydrogenedentes bacterium]|nr:hypothetical protein [Candidatus Hydrogenedentota bacterium]